MSKKNSLAKAKANHQALIQKEKDEAKKREAKKAARARKSVGKPPRAQPKNALRKAATPEAGVPKRKGAHRVRLRVRLVKAALKKSVGIIVQGAAAPAAMDTGAA